MSARERTTGASRLWGTTIDEVRRNGAAFRMYRDRPRRVGELLDLGRRWGERPHLVQGDRVVTFAELQDAVAATGAVLRGRGIGEGDRVLILGWNSPEWIVDFWATVAIGAVPVLANAWWSPSELADALERLDPALVLADERNARQVDPARPIGPWRTDAVGHPAPLVDPSDDEDAPAAIIFTSGTEGHPKAVVLSHRSLLAGLQMLLDITKRLPHQVDEETGVAALHTGPLFHIGGIQTLLRAMVVGDTLVMPAGRFDPAEALRLIEEWRISRWSAVPTMVTRVLEHPDAQTRDVTTLRSLTVGGAPVHAEFLERIRTGLPGVEPRIATGYGLTENGGQAVAASGKDTVVRPGTTGVPLPCVEVRIGPADGDRDGEILIRSATQMSGYFGDDPSPIDADGWLHTGDLGRIDDDGYLWITGRSKDMIIRGGENIAPAAVEAELARIPGVADAVVFGVPDADLGEQVMAVVVTTADLDGDDLRAALQGRVASFAVPSVWEFRVEPLPLNHAGKVDKPRIVAAARAARIAGADR